MFVQVGTNGVRHLLRGRHAKGSDGNTADADDVLHHHVAVHGHVGHGKSSGCGRMGMDNGFDVIPLPVTAEVHLHLGEGVVAGGTLENVQVHVHGKELIRCDEALGDAGGRTDDPVLIHTDGHVSVIGGDLAQLPHFGANVTYLFFHFCICHICLRIIFRAGYTLIY